MGHTAQALELLAHAPPTSDTLSLQAWIGPLVLIDAGRREEARAQLVLGRRLARDRRQVAAEAMNCLGRAKLALLLDSDPAGARAVLDQPQHQAVAANFTTIGEYTDLWHGLALLRESRDVEALARLRRAVRGMVAGERLLELPVAAVYLAEAEWRAGDEDAADAFVPKRIGFMALILSATPFGLRHRLARATKTDMLMLNADTDARAGHESRAIRAEARSVVCSRGCQCGRAITVKKSRK